MDSTDEVITEETNIVILSLEDWVQGLNRSIKTDKEDLASLETKKIKIETRINDYENQIEKLRTSIQILRNAEIGE